MPSSTPIYGFPYPLGTDPVGQGAQDIEDLATAVEAQFVATSVAQGLYKIVPTSVTGGSVSSNGDVTIGNPTNLVTINDAFVPSFVNYRVFITVNDFSNNDNSLWVKLETSLSTYVYSLQYNFWQNGVVSTFGQGNSGAWAAWSRGGVGALGGTHCVVDIMNPNVARYTTFVAHNAGDRLWGEANSVMRTATAYTTLYLNFPTGNMLGGTCRIYGYN